ncbi:MAG: glutamate--tRNA ligase family protein [Vicinamibacterales bacterium]
MTSPGLELTRFAPAPTGRLHLGHVANALYVWGLGQRRGARVVLRIEDHDAQRSRAEYEGALLDDLDWLGFTPNYFKTSEFRAGPCLSRQSDRRAIHRSEAERLIARGLVYACTCTRKTAAAAGGRTEAGCAGSCRTRELPLADDVIWRVRLGSMPAGFDDELGGPQRAAVPPEDPAIRDRRGNWTYQFAVAVDDHLQGVTLVIRGRDLLSSTTTQIRLAKLCGRLSPARFAHHPLVMKTATQKLSKSSGDTGIDELRADGWSAERVIGEAAARVGLLPAGASLPAGEAAGLFSPPLWPVVAG